ncbi:hypothetical protein [Actinoplanes sp. NPDC049802]|uniref:hypothetical protein n=1 Tax=Actinoplanes sp. NPDC049802 TaxID=3154742 RepID=UPI0033FFC9A4
MPDIRAFRTVCHEAARAIHAEVTGFRIAEHTTPGYHQAILESRGRSVAVTWIPDTPWVALAEPGDDVPLRFTDDPLLANALTASCEFRVLTTAELGRPFRHAEWPEISIHDVRYWQPATVGEALFNRWD